MIIESSSEIIKFWFKGVSYVLFLEYILSVTVIIALISIGFCGSRGFFALAFTTLEAKTQKNNKK
jgi:hypothetical protein